MKIEEVRWIFKVPSFAIGIIQKGQRSFKGFGYAEAETKREPDENTIYGMGPCTKAFTTTILSQLALKGDLDLDAPVSAKIPDLKTAFNPAVAEKMTVRDMVSHCVGLNQLIYEVVGRNGNVFAERTDVV